MMKNADRNTLSGREHETQVSDISFQNNVQMESHSSARKYCAGNVKESTLNSFDSVSSGKTRIFCFNGYFSSDIYFRLRFNSDSD